MKCTSLTIGNIRDRFKLKQFELNPPYQRRPVWKTKHRILLLSSIFSGIPIPALILHKHFDKRKKRDIYDVLDGKQRLETLLHFIELKSIDSEGEWQVKVKKNAEETLLITYNDLKSKRFNAAHNQIADQFWNYEIPIIEYEGEIADFFENSVPTKDVFVRINSTGSPLKLNEIRHASHNVPFFKLGEELEKKYLRLFQDRWKIFGENEIRRFVFHEYLLELCTAIYFQNFTDRRKKLDELLVNHTWKPAEIKQIFIRFGQIVQWMRSIFTDDIFQNTRFRNKSDFYSLFVVLNGLLDKKFVHRDLKSNRILGNTLVEFSKAAQAVSSELKTYDINKNWKGSEKEMLLYVIATRQATDTLRSRHLRSEYIKSLLKGFILKQKDVRRVFDPNIKGILWTRLLQKTKTPKCPNPLSNITCKKYLSLTDAQVDHLHPWSRGGRTTLKNAQLICSSCNKTKSAKSQRLR